MILVIAVFWNNTNVFITDLLTQLPIEVLAIRLLPEADAPAMPMMTH
ncbi:hypothetical protein BN126_4199 [Cronobacter sakazakii 680]|nr:hypothetical protein BN126_4199 [Cronobacter sakazakii 680]